MYKFVISWHIFFLAFTKESSFTPAKLTMITGKVPWRARYFSSFQISSPSNKSPLSAYSREKNFSSMLIFRVFPNRRGRTIRVTLSPCSHHSLIRLVLSI